MFFWSVHILWVTLKFTIVYRVNKRIDNAVYCEYGILFDF
jgi:hypothetical protein